MSSTISKNFRFTQDDVDLLDRLAEGYGLTAADTIRVALAILEEMSTGQREILRRDGKLWLYDVGPDGTLTRVTL